MSPFSFSLSHTLTVFVSIFRTAPPAEALSFLCFCSLWNSQPMAKKGSRFQLCSQGRMAFVFLLFFFASFSMSHTPKSLPKENGSWLWNTSHYEKSDLPCFGHFSINEKACFEDFWNKLINELWQGKWAGRKGCHMHPKISPSSTLQKRSSTQIFN